jgi:WD40 repeat protein
VTARVTLGPAVSVANAAQVRELIALQAHPNWVLSVAFSPDGARLASGGNSDAIRLWDAATGQLLGTFGDQYQFPTSLAWLPDGTRLAVANYTAIQVWDPVTGGLMRELEGHTDTIQSVAWSPDGTRLASAGYDGVVRLWDTATGAPLISLTGHTGQVADVAWSPDGTRLASAGWDDEVVRIWDTATGAQLSVLTDADFGAVLDLAFSPDGTMLAVGANLNLTLWDTRSWTRLREFDTGLGADCVAWSPDGRLLATQSGAFDLSLWNPRTGEELSVLEGHTSLIDDLEWSPDGARLASASWDGTVRLWGIP